MRNPPDPQRLHILIQLREQAGLSQAQMAQLCGLTGSTSRRSVAAWEVGESTPRTRHRLPFMRYLLDGLHLRDDPALFSKVWEILVEEWLWDPVSEDEWRTNVAPADGLPEPYLVAHLEDSKPSDGKNAPVDDVVAVAENETAPQTQKSSAENRLPLIATIGLLLLIAAAIGSWAIATDRRPAISTPHNLGFEDASLAPWVAQNEDACDLNLVEDPSLAKEGGQFLHMQKRGDDCHSVRMDKTVVPSLNAKHSFVVWVRSPDDMPRTGTLVLWQGEAPIEAVGHGVKENSEKAAVNFLATGDDWACVEVSNHLQDERYDVVRGEVYLDGDVDGGIDGRADADLLIDSAGFLEGETPGCPPTQGIQLIDGGFEHYETFSAWEWSSDQCDDTILTADAMAPEGSRYLATIRSNEQCTSIQQKVPTTVGQGQTVRGGIWTRTPDGELRDLTLAVRSLGTEDETTHAFRAGPDWRCYEVSMETLTGGLSDVQLEVYFDEPSESGPTYHLDGAFLTTDSAIGCPTETQGLGNDGFENAHTLLPWDWNGTCGFDVVADAKLAFEGERSLFVQREDERCISFYQDMPVLDSAEPAIFTAGIWARMTDATPRTAVLRLNQLGKPDDLAWIRFSPSHEQWQCFETTLRVPSLAGQFVYFEVFPERIGDGGYLFDNAMLVAGEQHVCPQTHIGINGLRADSADGRFFPGAAIGVEFGLTNPGSSDALRDHFIRAWVSESADGPPIAESEIAYLRMPPLPASTRFEPAHMDVAIPLHLSPGKTYYAVVEADQSSPALGAEGLGRDSLAFELTACYPDSLFCDVPLDHWARSEAEQWHEDGITSGCRSGTAPYQNRPFCPDMLVNRDMFAVVLLRQLLGSDYQPPAEYTGYFEDVAEDARFVQWIEALGEHGLVLPMTDCIADEGAARFCPNAPMTRRDLALVMADVLDWDLDVIEPVEFGDVTPEDPAMLAINYVWTEVIVDGQDPHCPQSGTLPKFCPEAPLARDSAAFMMTRAFDQSTTRD